MARRIPLKPLAQLCRRLGTSLAAGVDVRTTWKREVERAAGADKHGLNTVAMALASGGSFDEGLRQAGNAFPPLVRDLVAVGERTGHVDQVFLQLADYYEHLISLRRTYLSGIVWPAMQLGVALIVVGVLIWFSSIPGIDGKPIDFLGIGLVGTHGLIIYLVILACLALAIGAVIYSWRQGKLGGPLILKWLVHVPVLGECVQTQALARMAWALGLAVDTGMGARQCMRVALESTHNGYFAGLAPVVDPELARGVPFHEALRATGAFPLEFLDTLEAGEEAGSITEALNRLSGFYHERAKAQTEVITTVATFATWGLVGSILIFLIFRLASSYLGTINSLL